MFFEANAASHRASGELSNLKWPNSLVSDRIHLGLGSRVMVAGLTAPEILPALRLSLGLAGQLVILDPNDEALRHVSLDDAFWAVVLKARAERMPVMDGSLDAVLCWSSFMGLGPLSQVTGEFFRVLTPGGKVFVAYAGESMADRPCLAGLESLFLKAGFSRLDSEEEADFFLFKAEKVAGFNVSLSAMGRA